MSSSCIDHGVDGDMYYYAMEYVDGETLTARLRREKRLPWREVVELSIQICVALKAAHDAGIIHRDLKPSNLLLAPDGRIKLTDFGVAQVFAGSKLTVTGGIIGTAEYMSPEQGQGRRITKRSDLYSLGAVMYVMLTGRPPFSGKTTLDVIHKHTYSQFDRPRLRVPEIPHWLDEIVCQLMEKDPEKRFADAYVVNRRLQELLRKIELSTNDLTLDGRRAPTHRRSTSPPATRSASVRGMSVGPGSGTLMRDLFRAEIEAQKAPSRLRAILENTWLLVGALVIVIAGVDLLDAKQGHDPGAAIRNEASHSLTTMRKPTGEQCGMSISRRCPRSSRPNGMRGSSPYTSRIRIDELKAALNKKSLRRGPAKREPASEIERILTLSRHQQEDGDSGGGGTNAFRPWRPCWPTIRNTKRSTSSCKNPSRISVAEAWSSRPTAPLSKPRSTGPTAWRRKGNAKRPCHIWQGIVDLYKNDPQAAPLVERCRDGNSGPHPAKQRLGRSLHERAVGAQALHSLHPRFSQAGDPVPRYHAAVGRAPGVPVRDRLAGRSLSRGRVNAVVAAEARGFIFAAPLALALKARFIPVRKPGKLPFDTHSFHYELEYGTDSLEMHTDAVSQADRVLLVDDLLATGGTMGACIGMVEKAGAVVVGTAFLIELDFLKGRQRLAPHEVFSLVHYADET